MELVGVRAHGQDKVGVDAAELAGWGEPTGVTATDDVDALLAARPDACCYSPLWPSIDELERLLAAGVNVHLGSLDHRRQAVRDGPREDPKSLRARQFHDLRQRCPPGMTNMVGMVLSGACERVDEIRITESVELLDLRVGRHPDRDGFRLRPRDPDLAEVCAAKRGVRRVRGDDGRRDRAHLDRMTFDVTFTAATGDTDLGFMTIPEGTVGGFTATTAAGSVIAMWSASDSTGLWATT